MTAKQRFVLEKTGRWTSAVAALWISPFEQ